MDFVRTPDARFGSVPDFANSVRYASVPAVPEGDGAALRMAYIDEGPRDARTVVMLHGEPSWSFLYRKVIRACVAAGLRVIVPDLIGFGRSDKPTKREDYTYARHVAWVKALLDAAAPTDATLLCQDWGGLLGLRIAGEEPHRFARIVAANTFLPTGDRKPAEAFFAWRDFSQNVPELPVAKIVSSGCARELSPDVLAAYDAPFPDETFKAGARQFPMLVPASPDDPASEDNRRAWAGLSRFDKPFLTAFGDSDPITAGADRALQKHVPGAAGQPHTTLARAGHFLQEDAGDELGSITCAFTNAKA
jgi:haloalkane dehalogenase